MSGLKIQFVWGKKQRYKIKIRVLKLKLILKNHASTGLSVSPLAENVDQTMDSAILHPALGRCMPKR